MQHHQNPYIDIHHRFTRRTFMKQHASLVRAFNTPPVVYTLPSITTPLPDLVFLANGGLSLPGLPGPVVLLPHMRYAQRQAELPYLKTMYHRLGIPTIDYPGQEPFEGQAELKWFDGGKKAICGYGFRSTKRTFVEVERLFKKLYASHAMRAPELLVVELISPHYYHLDVAMLEYSERTNAKHALKHVNKCILHKRAFSAASIKKIMKFLGKEHVTVLDTTDSFCLNAVVDDRHLITHRLKDPVLKPMFEQLTGRTVVEVDTSEFETSGGSVRCMTLDLYV